MINLTPLHIAKFWMSVEADVRSVNLRDDRNWYGKCWIWKGSLFQSGYGRFHFKYKAYRAHRVSYFLYNGSISKDKFICHKCDNPKCVNPKHLFEGTASDNSVDMSKKNRGKKEGKCKESSSKYLGVLFRKDNGKWRSRYMINGKNFYIGQFDTELEAAKAYNDEVIRLGLDKTLNNFTLNLL